jgi:hypothetical protein
MTDNAEKRFWTYVTKCTVCGRTNMVRADPGVTPETRGEIEFTMSCEYKDCRAPVKYRQEMLQLRTAWRKK